MIHLKHYAQQTRGIHSKLFQCWASVEDSGPTLKQNWVNASFICWDAEINDGHLDIVTMIHLKHYAQQTWGIYSMLFQCWASVEDGGPTLKQNWVNASFVCWDAEINNGHLDIVTMIHLEYNAQQTRGIHSMLFQCWAHVEDGGPTLKQHWVNASCLISER